MFNRCTNDKDTFTLFSILKYVKKQDFNKARDTLETQGAPDTQRTAKILGRPKDSKGFQKNPKTSK